MEELSLEDDEISKHCDRRADNRLKRSRHRVKLGDHIGHYWPPTPATHDQCEHDLGGSVPAFYDLCLPDDTLEMIDRLKVSDVHCTNSLGGDQADGIVGGNLSRRCRTSNYEWTTFAGGGAGLSLSRVEDGGSSASGGCVARRAKRPTDLPVVPHRPHPSLDDARVADEKRLHAQDHDNAERGCAASSSAVATNGVPTTGGRQRRLCQDCRAASCRCWRDLNLRSQTFLDCDNRLVCEDSCGSGSEGDLASDPYYRECMQRINDSHLGATHRGTHKFVPRHADEVGIDIGDPVHITEECEDLWCKGVNLRTGASGIIPAVCLTDLNFYTVAHEDSAVPGMVVKQPRARAFKVRFLGSVEVKQHKGSQVVAEAIQKVVLSRRLSEDSPTAPLCRLEVTEAGVKMIDLTQNKRMKKAMTDIKSQSVSDRLCKLMAFHKESKAVSNHFFALKNISYCGCHPHSDRYLAFITKHPTLMRFACHCYTSLDGGTRDIAAAVGDAFQKYYIETMAFSHQTEDIYIE